MPTMDEQPTSLRLTAEKLRTGEWSLAEYVSRACDRLDAREPHLHALLPEPNRRARLLSDAEALAARFPEPAQRPPLYGMLLGVKDVFRTDGFPTHAGSALPADLFAGPEAPVVTRLREAGALVLGKTVTTEFAYFEPGPTRNPRDPERTPGGSSSGSAAAVAAGYCPLALGTQTVGSVLRPASFCGVVGFKPTYGLLPTEGVIPYAPSLDHVGFFVPEAVDLPLALQALGITPAVSEPPRVLMLPEGPYLEAADPEMREQLERWATTLTARGWAVHFGYTHTDLEGIAERNQWLASAEMAQVHQDWYPQYRDLYRPRTRTQIEAGQAVPPDQLQAAREGQLLLRRKLEGWLDLVGASAWICPAAPGVAPRGLASTGDPALNMPWTYAGLPAVSLPIGINEDGLPLGLQLVARAGKDAELAVLAQAVTEDLAEVRR